MKKNLLILGLVAFLGLSVVSCSADDSYVNDDSQANYVPPVDNGDKEFPKPPMKP
ncbi:hypothetical protein [Flavobacterium sp.]|uniref:hypothetical protein n=1 Tax=Flavobacterium sp. TaxID=239 RepID=UPI002626D419|nr:hypothetical protein [Flavobacterium sp.]